jgi:hypothetical protein
MINVVLIIALILLIVYLNNHYEGFELYFNTAENRKKYTCDLIKKPENIDYNDKKSFDETDPFQLTYSDKTHEAPYAKCDDNVMDFNIEDNYKLNFDTNFKKYLGNPAKSGDIFYELKKTCPNTSPVIYKF